MAPAVKCLHGTVAMTVTLTTATLMALVTIRQNAVHKMRINAPKTAIQTTVTSMEDAIMQPSAVTVLALIATQICAAQFYPSLSRRQTSAAVMTLKSMTYAVRCNLGNALKIVPQVEQSTTATKMVIATIKISALAQMSATQSVQTMIQTLAAPMQIAAIRQMTNAMILKSAAPQPQALKKTSNSAAKHQMSSFQTTRSAVAGTIKSLTSAAQPKN